MNAELAKAKRRVEQAWQEAVKASYDNMSPYIDHDYTLRLWSRSVEEQFRSQWCSVERHDDAGWNWSEVRRNYRGPKDVIVALEAEDQLCALALFRLTRDRVLVRFLEGDPRAGCNMKGSRALVMLDLAATLGQRYGCKEIHLQPVNDDLKMLYVETYGFEEGKDGSCEPILKRGLL